MQGSRGGWRRREGATMFMTLLGVYALLLNRYSGQEDIVIGTPIANRRRKELEGLIGFFVNTLVMRVGVRGEESYRELLRRVKEEALGAYEHQDLPFEKLVEELQPERSLSHSPVFQVMFVMQNAPQGEMISDQEGEGGAAKYDLTMTMAERCGRLCGVIEYNRGLYDAETIRRMICHYKNLLESVSKDIGEPVSELEMMSEEEREQILVRWNDTRAEYEREKSIQEMFELQVEETPREEAVVYEEERISYEGLNRRANQLARYLRSKGVREEVRVGICVERSIEMVVGVLGVIKAGGAYVPLDPAYPKERLKVMLEDSRAAVVLTQRHLVGEMPEHEAEVVCIDEAREGIAEQSGENLVSEVSEGNLAYVIYTSGSTGRPKGVAIEHRSAIELVKWG